MENTFVNIHAEKVPNPDAMKFTIANLLLTKGAYEYNSEEEAKASPLAAKLFGFNYVERVFISKNFVTVTKKPNLDAWESMMIDIRIVIKKHLEHGEPLFNFEDPNQEPTYAPHKSLEEKIRMTIDQQIRPATWEDGGDLRFVSFENGVVKVGMAGACIRCPFASRTIKHGVEVILKRQFPEIQSVTTEDVNWADTVQEENPEFDRS